MFLQKFQKDTKIVSKKSPKKSDLSFFISHGWSNHSSFYVEYEIIPIYLTSRKYRADDMTSWHALFLNQGY